MYLNKFRIAILSGDKEKTIENILRSIDPLEDSEYSFETVSDIDDLKEFGSLDSAVIFDGAAGAECIKAAGKFRFSVLILSVCEYLKADKKLLSQVYDIWVTPDENRYDKELIEIGYSKLAGALKSAADSRKLEICLETTIDSIPDLVWFKDTDGAHLKVNDGFCEAVDKTKEQIYKKGHYYIWDIPKEEYEQGEFVCLESEDIVMEARETCLFDEMVKTKSGMRQFKTYKSPLIDEDGNIFGTCGVAHDVTDFHNINSEIKVMLESMPFGTVLEDRQGKIISVNKKFEQLFGSAEEVLNKDYGRWRDALFASSSQIEYDKLVRNVNGEEVVLRFSEENIIDIFDEKMGTLVLFTDITKEYLNEKTTLKHANTDFLTGLNNRRSLFSYLDKIGSDREVSLLMIDLDNFKNVNDNYGHQSGDDALVLVSDILRKCFPKDFTARLGGDEFLVVINRGTSLSELEEIAQKLIDAICDEFGKQERFSGISASVGVSLSVLYNGGKHDITELMAQSDKALYRAKEMGKSRYCVYSEK